MRVFDRDLIREGIMAGGHVNRERQAEHMAAPHRFCDVKIFLANTEPSTHGPKGKSGQ